MIRRLGPLSALLVLSMPAASAAIDAPRPVAPGAPGRALEADPCPVFSWSARDRDGSLELRVIDRTRAAWPEDDRPPVEERADRPVLSVRLPGGARSWTPPLEDCLLSGGDFEWSIRRDGAERPSPWSPPHRFSVRTTPAASSLDQLLRRAQSLEPSPLDPPDRSGAAEPAPRSVRAAAPGLAGLPAHLRVAGRLEATAIRTRAVDGETAGRIRLDASRASSIGGRLVAGWARFDRTSPVETLDPDVDLGLVPQRLKISDPSTGGANGDLTTGKVAVDQLILFGPIHTERSGFVGEGGAGLFRAPVRGLLDADRTVDIDDNAQLCELCSGASCSSAVVMGARLFHAGGDQIGLQVLCGESP